MTIKKLLWTVTIGLAATAVCLVVRRSIGDRQEGSAVGYAGNESTAVFHRLDCRLFQADESSPVFITRRQALDAGYRPCGVCCP